MHGEGRHSTPPKWEEQGNFPLPQFRPVARFLEECGFKWPALEWVWPSGRRETLSLRAARGRNGAVSRSEIKRRVDGRWLRLGVIVFSGDGHDDPEFQRAFKTVCDAFADTLIRTLEHGALRRREIAHEKIAHHAEDPRPGTAVARSLVALASLVKAYHAFYASVDDNQLCVEYKAPGGKRHGKTGGIVLNPCPEPVSVELRDALKLGRAVEWTDHRQEILALAQTHNLGYQIKCHYLIQPVLRHGELVGIFALGVPEDVPILADIYREPLADAADKLAQAAHFLFQRRFLKLIVDPVFQSRDTRTDPEQVFVLMPFTLDWSDRIWKRVLQPTLDGLGVRAIRADDLYGRDVVEDIWSGILGSRFVVADITDRNPNVFYELGLAHTVGKDVILLTQDVGDIPFDLNRFRHIVYEDNMDGYDALRTGLVNSARHVLGT